MMYFAEVDANDRVIRVVPLEESVANGKEQKGTAFLEGTFGGKWIMATTDGSARVRMPGPGFKLDRGKDAFVPPQPFASWKLDPKTLDWEPPATRPTKPSGKELKWDETNKRWVVV